jgi:PIN domain nuclease of toxin-antitoxin system
MWSDPSGVLDTHALVWWTLDPDLLSQPARRACREMERRGGLVSSISVWEIGILVKRSRLELPTALRSYLARLRQLAWLRVVPVEAETWLANLELDWTHRDPADRTIVALANSMELPLVTCDRSIRDFYSRAVW